MKCWYDHRGEPYLRLQPVKVEQHSIEPLLFTFHDIISDEEIQAVKQLALPLVTAPFMQLYLILNFVIDHSSSTVSTEAPQKSSSLEFFYYIIRLALIMVKVTLKSSRW